MASEKTENIGLTVYPDVTGVYQRELRKSYDDNFFKIDNQFKIAETELKNYVDTKLGEIENGSY